MWWTALARVEAGKAGAIEPLVVLLRDSRDQSVVRNAAFAIANLCLDNSAIRLAMLHAPDSLDRYR